MGLVAFTEAFLTNVDAFTLAAQTESSCVAPHRSLAERVQLWEQCGHRGQSKQWTQEAKYIMVLCRCDV